MAEQYTSIKTILDKAMRHPLLQDITLETAVDYAVDFMRIVGVPNMFLEKTEIIDIDDYRAALPCDYYQTIQVRDKSSKVPYVYATDSFFFSEQTSAEYVYTYKIQGNIIFTNTCNKPIEMSYLAIAVDDEGFPMIPDNASFIRALISYIKLQWFTILFDMDKIKPAVLAQAQQDYAWAVGDCQNEFQRLSIDKAESFFNSFSRMILTNNHRTSFHNINIKEHINLQ